VRRRVIAALLTIAVALASSPIAHAHGDDGTFEPVSIAQGDGLVIDVQVVLTYTNDGERVDDPATVVQARATNAAGAVAGPVDLAPASAPGAFVGSLAVPEGGTWTVTLTSTTPLAALDVPGVVVAETGTTTTTAAPTATSTTAADGDTTTGARDDEDGSPIVLVLVGLVVIGAVVGFVLSRRRA